MEIKIYGSEGCHFCKLAVDLVTRMMREYEYIDINDNIDEFSKLFPNARTVPQILIDGEWIGGYSDLEKVMEKL